MEDNIDIVNPITLRNKIEKSYQLMCGINITWTNADLNQLGHMEQTPVQF